MSRDTDLCFSWIKWVSGVGNLYTCFEYFASSTGQPKMTLIFCIKTTFSDSLDQPVNNKGIYANRTRPQCNLLALYHVTRCANPNCPGMNLTFSFLLLETWAGASVSVSFSLFKMLLEYSNSITSVIGKGHSFRNFVIYTKLSSQWNVPSIFSSKKLGHLQIGNFITKCHI